MSDARDIRVDAGPVWAQGVDVRASFIVSTYVHLLLAILAFVAIEFAIFSSGNAELLSRWMLTLPGGDGLLCGGRDSV